MNNIESVGKQALCSACGACVDVCPTKAIQIKENAGGYLCAEIDGNQCVNCGQCKKVCPSIAKNHLIENPIGALQGNYEGGFIGYASQKKVRWYGQSGGVVTALLLYLLESGKIDGAVTNQFDSELRRPKAVYVTCKEELMNSCGSYYAQSSVAQTVLEHKEKRLAAVVLGCQGKALELYQKEHDGAGRPEYLLGLICAGQNSGHMIDRLVEKAECKEERPQKFRFRFSHPAYGGWPGNVMIITDRRRYILDKSERTSLKSTHEAYRCLLCYDHLCPEADVVFGDPWRIPGNHLAGETVVIARTEKGMRLLQEAQEARYVELKPLPAENILKAQLADTLLLKKAAATFSACKRKGWVYPYSVTQDAQTFLEKNAGKAQKEYLPRLLYTRARFLADTSDQVEALEKTYKQSLLRKAHQQKWKRTALLPIRGVRFVFRQIRKK